MIRTNTSPKAPAAPHFPTYLLPSLKIPFLRRRQSSATTTSSAVSNDVPSLSSSPISTTSTDDFPSSPNTSTSPGVETYSYIIPDDKPAFKKTPVEQPTPTRDSTHDRLGRTLPDVLRCNTCGTDVAYGLQIVSKGFTGRHGRALLVSAPLSASTPSCPASPPLPFPPSSAIGRGGGSSSSSSGSNTPVSPGHHALARDGTNLVNITVGRPEARNLVTGAHVVADINCATCGVKIGWKYVDAREQAQKYKVGKFILETERVVLFRSWEDVLSGEEDKEPHRHFYSSSAPAGSFGGRRKSSILCGSRKVSCSSEGAGRGGGFVVEEGEEGPEGEEGEEGEESCAGESEEEIIFDSDDEDECEDIFAGVWDAATVARRRSSKVSGGSRYDTRKGRGADGSR